jgi:hypothetical protein
VTDLVATVAPREQDAVGFMVRLGLALSVTLARGVSRALRFTALAWSGAASAVIASTAMPTMAPTTSLVKTFFMREYPRYWGLAPRTP